MSEQEPDSQARRSNSYVDEIAGSRTLAKQLSQIESRLARAEQGVAKSNMLDASQCDDLKGQLDVYAKDPAHTQRGSKGLVTALTGAAASLLALLVMAWIVCATASTAAVVRGAEPAKAEERSQPKSVADAPARAATPAQDAAPVTSPLAWVGGLLLLGAGGLLIWLVYTFVENAKEQLRAIQHERAREELLRLAKLRVALGTREGVEAVLDQLMLSTEPKRDVA